MRLRLLLAVAVVGVVSSRDARACTAPAPSPPIAIPRTGARDVTTLVDIVVVAARAPSVTLETAAGVAVPLGPPVSMGFGWDDVTASHGEVFRLRPGQELAPETEHVVKVSLDGAAPTELTRFTTAKGYAKPAGTAPAISAATFTRVRYPLDEISSGDCVSAEYHGFVSLDWSLGTFPDTPADSVVHVLTVAPKTGGPGDSFVWIGTKPFTGQKTLGAHPLPIDRWHPYFDPTREYCFAVTAMPYGDAVLPTRAAAVCGPVAQLAAPGAPPFGTANGGAASDSSGGGCRWSANAGASPWALVALVSLARSRRRRRA